MNAQMRYQVFFTPLLVSDSNTYGDEIDVSDRVKISGIGSIRRSIDSSDYDVGVFVFSDLELTGQNYQGYFNEDDNRSIFMTTRDRCKVRVVFKSVATIRNSGGTVTSETIVETSTFNGLINEEGTRANLVTESIKFKVLSRDSVLRTTQVSGGVVTNGATFTQAFTAILNVPRITSVLNFSLANINPAVDLTIDNGSWFDNKSVKEALDKLLFAANSVLLINDAGDIIVRSRAEDTTNDILYLYGKNDVHRRENIIDITAYNTGRQRMFTAFTVNDTERTNSAFVQAYGLRKKSIDLPFITDPENEAAIADFLVEEFKTPKIELNVKVQTEIAKTVELLDRVSVSYPLRVKPIEGKFLPVIGVTKIGETDQPLPYTFGSIEIPGRLGFKVIEIEDNPENFTSILKLRQIGTDTGDGVFDAPGNCLIGLGIIGEAIICSGGDDCDSFNPAIIGSAKIGCTNVA